MRNNWKRDFRLNFSSAFSSSSFRSLRRLITVIASAFTFNHNLSLQPSLAADFFAAIGLLMAFKTSLGCGSPTNLPASRRQWKMKIEKFHKPVGGVLSTVSGCCQLMFARQNVLDSTNTLIARGIMWFLLMGFHGEALRESWAFLASWSTPTSREVTWRRETHVL